MSNWLGIATVSGVLGARLRAVLAAAGLGFDVTISHPLDTATHGVFVHLYSVLPNATLRNETLPERSADGSVVVPARLALDLYYQLTFVGNPVTYDAERLAGAVMTGLNEYPVLTSQEISDFLAAQPADSVLASSNLADQVERVRVTPLAANIEDLSRLWGMTQRNFHRLSVPYRASAVMLEPDVDAVTPLPVTDPQLTVFQLRRPRITSVGSSAGRAAAVVEFGEEMVISGSALRGDVTEIVLADQRRPPDAARDAELRLRFDAASGLRAGVYVVQVRHRIELENGETRDGADSNTVPAALAPRMALRAAGDGGAVTATADPAGHAIHVRPEPVPTADQDVELSLTPLAATPARSSTEWALEDGGVGVAVTFAPPIDAGDYLVRLVVDGAESLLSTDGNGVFDGPAVTVA